MSGRTNQPELDHHLGTTTVLFTDLVESTRFMSDHGEISADDARRRHLGLVRRVAERHDGRFVKNLGDGAMAVFSSAVAAVTAAIDIQEESEPGDPDVRIGISAGDVIAEDDDYFGTPVVVASRLCSRAREGQILVARLVVELAGTRVEHQFHPVGSLSLKGIADPVASCEVRVGDSPLRGVESEPTEHAADRAPLPGPMRAARGAFVGRPAELQTCLDAVRIARTGVPQVVLLEGEAGMGKTRLATEVAVDAHAAGGLVLLGRCEPDDPFGPFKQALESTAEIIGEEAMRATLERVGGDLLHLSPRLKSRFVDLAPGTDADGDRFRLFDAVRAWLSDLAADQLVVVVLDDFHAADPGSLALARHLGRSSISAQLVLVATVRTDLVNEDVTDLVTDLHRLEIVTTLDLGGLPADDVATLAEDWAGHEVEHALIRRLTRDTGGNPLFVREMLRTLGERGVFENEGTLVDVLEHTELPSSVRGIIGHRIEGLTEHARAVLTAGAVLGPEFSTSLLRRMVRLPDDLVLVGIEEAVSSGLISEAAGSPGQLRFDHDVARRAIYEDIPLSDRVLLHQRTAEALETLAERGETISKADIAQHYVAASPVADPSRTASVCESAGDVAVDGLAYESAAARFRQALDALQTPPPEETVRLLHKEGMALWAANRVDDARRVLRKAADIAETADLPVDLARIAVSHQGETLGGLFFVIGSHDEEGLELIDRALEAMDKDDSPERALLLSSRALGSVWDATDDERLDLCDEAEAMARRVADPPVLARVLARTAMARHGADTPATEISRFEEAERLAIENGLESVRASCVVGRVIATYEMGQVDAAFELLAASEQLLASSRDPYNRHWLQWAQTTVLALRGDLDQAEANGEAIYSSTVGDMADRPTAGVVATYASSITMTRLHAGRVGEYGAVLRELGDAAESLHIFRLGEAMAALDVGDADRARALLHGVDLAGLPRNGAWASTMMAAVEVAWLLDDRATVGLLWSALAPIADRCDSIFLCFSFGSLARSVAMLATMRGDHDQALELLDQAREIHERLGSRPMLVYGDALTAEVLLRRGRPQDRDTARELLDTTDATAAAGGFHYTCEQIRRTRALYFDSETAPRSLGETRRRVSASLSGSITRGRAAVTTRVQRGVKRLVDDKGDDEIERRFQSEARLSTLVRGIALGFRPDRARGFAGSIVFSTTYATPHLGAREPLEWTIEVADSSARVVKGRPADPTIVIHLTVADLVRFVAGELSTVTSLLDGRVRVEGSLELGGRIPEMFGTAIT